MVAIVICRLPEYGERERVRERAFGENAIRRARSFLRASPRLDAILIQTVIYSVRARDYCIINLITAALCHLLSPARRRSPRTVPLGKPRRPNESPVVTTATLLVPLFRAFLSQPSGEINSRRRRNLCWERQKESERRRRRREGADGDGRNGSAAYERARLHGNAEDGAYIM